MNIENKYLETKHDVGIVGYWYATNYGSVITYYALSKAINKCGFTSMLIDCPNKENDPEGEDVFSRRFLLNHVDISISVKKEEMYRINDMCNIFMVGSDQVWTRDAIRIMQYMFFLDFADDSKKKIAYAPSFGNNTFNLSPEERGNVQKLIKRFNKISVREDVGVNIVKDMFDCKAERVLDPVFLMNEEEYDEIASESSIDTNDDYLLAYILDPTPEKEKCVLRIAEQKNLKIKVVLDGRKFTFERNLGKLQFIPKECVIEKVEEEDWVKLFKDANYVFTDSHHGLAMTIIYGKQFICYANYGRGYARFTSLMNLFGIIDRLIQSPEEVEPLINREIQYDAVDEKLSIEKEKSIAWLSSALNVKDITKSIEHNLNFQTSCSGCSACYNVCPTNAIIMCKNQEGFLNPIVDAEKCINCGLCVKCCTTLHPVDLHNHDSEPKCMATWADDKIREVSSSGGMFTVLANYVLSCKGIVYGAVFGNDYTVKHIKVTKEEDLSAIRGSKYIQSEIGLAFREIKEQLDSDKTVLFTGMPCQVAGLKSYLQKDYLNLYTVDILCHGITSHKVFKKYQKDVLGNKEIIDLQFKAKKPWGWHAGVNAKFSDGTKYQKIIEEDPYYIAYIQGLSKNKMCGTCRYNVLPRVGELTIGDFWRIQDFDKSLNDNKGTSVVLINNGKGQNLFDRIESKLQKSVEVPLRYAIAGNGIIKYPYKLNAKRDEFFAELDNWNFNELIRELLRKPADQIEPPTWYTPELRELFYIARYAYANYNKRKVVLWGNNDTLKYILGKYFDIKVDCVISENMQYVNGTTCKHISYLKGRAKEFFVIAFGKPYNVKDIERFKEYGYTDFKDVIYRSFNPIIMEDVDLSVGYKDFFGNMIRGTSGKIKKVVFRGFNNRVDIDKDVWGLNNLIIDLTANSKIKVGAYCNFTQPYTHIESRGNWGSSLLRIDKGCIFMDSVLRMFTNPHISSISIGERSTFGERLSLRANSGKKIIIGKDCQFSSYIEVWAGDGHSIFDVKTGKNINAIYSSKFNPKDCVYIGSHVWVGVRSIILNGTSIGDGSIIGAQSTVKGHFKNNCTIAGNPAIVRRKDIAWAREMCTEDPLGCNGFYRLTNEANPPIYGRKVLVIGGTRFMGIKLVKQLIRLGNDVTIATRGKANDDFGDDVKRVILDIAQPDTVRNALAGQEFDVIFHNLAYCSNYVKNLLSVVKCDRYVQLSSVAVYGNKPELFLHEKDYDPNQEHLVWNDTNAGYFNGKRQAEVAILKEYSGIEYVLVRIPYVTKTDRLFYYCDCIVNSKPMKIDNIDGGMAFVRDDDVGQFLPWIAAQGFKGIINFGAEGYTTIHDLLTYIENKTGKKAIIDEKNGMESPFQLKNKGFALDVSNAKALGYPVPQLNEWFWKLVDEYIERALNNKQ